MAALKVQEAIAPGERHEAFQENLARRIAALRPQLVRCARALTRDPIKAEDLAQTVILRALGKQHLYREKGELYGWLSTIMRRAWLDETRKSARENLVFLKPASTTLLRAAALDEAQYYAVLYREVRRAIDALPSEQKEVVLMCRVDGVPIAKVAELRGIPIGTIRSRLYRGCARIGRRLEI